MPSPSRQTATAHSTQRTQRNAEERRLFGRGTLSSIAKTKYFYVRAGDEHKHIAIWVVVVGERVLVRSWNDKPGGWYRAFLAEKTGHVRIGTREVPVRAGRVRGERLLDAMDAAYAAKYETQANLKYVKGFGTKRRRATTLELTPA